MLSMNAFDASSEKSLGTPPGHEEHAVPAVLGLAVHREEDLNGEYDVALRMMRRACARPAERTHHVGGLPNDGVGRRVQLPGRTGISICGLPAIWWI